MSTPTAPAARPASEPHRLEPHRLEPHRLIDRRRPRTGTRTACAMLLLVTLGALGHVGVQLKSFEVAYELGKERKIRGQLEEEQRLRKLEVGRLKDPSRIMQVARERLGLEPPAATNVVSLDHLASRPVDAPSPPEKAARPTSQGGR